MPRDPIQAPWEQEMKLAQLERAEKQMTLGAMIERIARVVNLDPHALVYGLGAPHSYRGYYMDLAFVPNPEPITAEHALALLRGCVDMPFYGYKGGEFVMGFITPVWSSHYGTTGRPILDLEGEENHVVKLVTGEMVP